MVTQKQAYSLLRSYIGQYFLDKKQYPRCKEIIDEVETILEGLAAPDSAVYSAFYHMKAMYFKHLSNSSEFFKAGLMYLAYTPLKTLTAAQKKGLALDLAMAALTGDDVYNFGELISHEILLSLKETEDLAWLPSMVEIFNDGNIAAYRELSTKFKDQISREKSLASNFAALEEKISILGLIELVFSRPAGKRVITFKDIQDRTHRSVDEVEGLVMKALSLGLIRGEIDEVEGIVSISWVRPRVLGLTQIKSMESKLDSWTKKVTATLTTVEDATPDVLIEKAMAE
eukprot:TRINITY_DN3086_c0_g2_i1.p1 TRINITY_DN3086_c0_g2~~TRINITY_DN3086_c0_g2_i1.p1  ORF type:complete len:296 (+),score=23.40 TRINITY_DN3086_c0_g2_i1:32-889(+)